jgi:hypothetical protein
MHFNTTLLQAFASAEHCGMLVGLASGQDAPGVLAGACWPDVGRCMLAPSHFSQGPGANMHLASGQHARASALTQVSYIISYIYTHTTSILAHTLQNTGVG